MKNSANFRGRSSLLEMMVEQRSLNVLCRVVLVCEPTTSSFAVHILAMKGDKRAAGDDDRGTISRETQFIRRVSRRLCTVTSLRVSLSARQTLPHVVRGN